MKVYEVIKRISLPVIALVLTACQAEEAREGASAGERVTVRLNLGMSAPVNAASADARRLGANTAINGADGKAFGVRLDREASVDAASSRAVNTVFYNLWAFQFNADGTIVGSPQQLSTSQTPVEAGANLSVSLTVGKEQTIYLVAGGKKLAPGFADIKTLAALEAYKLNYIISDKGAYASAIVAAADIPYAGCIKGTNVISLGQGAGMLEYNSPEGFSGSIGMKELVSKVTLRYKYDVETHTLQGVRLNNVNSHITLGTPAFYTPTDGVEFKLLNLQTSTPDAQGYYTASWYVAQNMQGTNANIASEMDRYYKEGGNLAPQYGLCLEVLGRSKETQTKYSVHRIFVGKNNTSNFDVEANHHYSLTTEFTTGYIAGSTTDPRLEASEFTSPKIVFYSSRRLTTGGLCTILGSNTYDLDAHYDCRPIAVEVSGASVELGIYADAACTQLVRTTDPAQNWLQLSVESNYTQALNNHTSPLTNRISMEARVPTKLNFYLYNDEYVNVKQDNTSLNRSLYLKITTTELDVANPRKTEDRMKIDQRAIKVYGLFGGWDDTNKEYTSLVGMDQIEEYKYAYTQPEPVMTRKMLGGNYNASTTYIGILTDMSDGMVPTIFLAENRANWSKGALDQPEIPRKIGGKIDLYQYDYYNSFSTRYCYDRNRDLDGNGILENPNRQGVNEIRWYLPSGNQWLGCYIDEKFSETGSYWSSNLWGNSPGGIYANSGLMWSSNSGMNNTNEVKCVRNLSLTFPVVSFSPKVVIESLLNTDGSSGTEKYAVIDASQLKGTTIRGDDFYDEVPLYEYKTEGGGDKVMESDKGTQKKVRRVKRHLLNTGPDKLISRKFAVAPDNISINGVLKSNWATVGGWDVLANSKPYNDTESFRAVEQGCPMYKGTKGKDTPGTWRLPTKKELTLMQIYSKGLYATNSETSFVSLVSSYCAATEDVNNSCIYLNMISVSSISKTRDFKFYARCIRDIP